MGDALRPEDWDLTFPTHPCVCTRPFAHMHTCAEACTHLGWKIPPGVECNPVKTHSPCCPLVTRVRFGGYKHKSTEGRRAVICVSQRTSEGTVRDQQRDNADHIHSGEPAF